MQNDDCPVPGRVPGPFSARLTTSRLTLRPLEVADAEAYAALADDDGVARFTGSLVTPFLPHSAALFAMRQPSLERRGLGQHWVIEVDGEFAGCLGLTRADPADDYEIGYFLGRPYWGRGYASEAVAAVVSEHTRVRPAQAVTARVFADNPASLRVLEKSAFVIEGPERGYCMQRQAELEGWRLTRPPFRFRYGGSRRGTRAPLKTAQPAGRAASLKPA